VGVGVTLDTLFTCGVCSELDELPGCSPMQFVVVVRLHTCTAVVRLSIAAIFGNEYKERFKYCKIIGPLPRFAQTCVVFMPLPACIDEGGNNHRGCAICR